MEIAVQKKKHTHKKQQSNLDIHKGLWASKLAAKEVLHREQNLNSSQQAYCVGIQVE